MIEKTSLEYTLNMIQYQIIKWFKKIEIRFMNKCKLCNRKVKHIGYLGYCNECVKNYFLNIHKEMEKKKRNKKWCGHQQNGMI
jgi:hypothetical protein